MYEHPPEEPVANLIPRNGNQRKIFGIGVCMICSVLSIIAILIVLALIPLYIPNRSVEIIESIDDSDNELIQIEMGTDTDYAERRVVLPIDQEAFSTSLDEAFELDPGTLNVSQCELVDDDSTSGSGTRRRRQFKRGFFKKLFKVIAKVITDPPCLAGSGRGGSGRGKRGCGPKKTPAKKEAIKKQVMNKIQTPKQRTINVPLKNGRTLNFAATFLALKRNQVTTKAPVTTQKTTSATTKSVSSAATNGNNNPTTVKQGVTSSLNILSTAGSTATAARTSTGAIASTTARVSTIAGASTPTPVVSIIGTSTTAEASTRTEASTTVITSTTTEASTTVITSTTTVDNTGYGINLVVNGDGETGTCIATYLTTQQPTGWSTISGAVSQVTYNNTADMPVYTTPGPSNRGNCFFYGGIGSGSISQTINLTSYMTAIDNSQVSFNLSAWLGGYMNQADDAAVSVTFLNSLSQPIGNQVTIGPITPAERNSTTSFLFRQTSGSVPTGTRYITATAIITIVSGTYTDSYADNIAIVLSRV